VRTGPFASPVSVTEETGLYDAGNLFVSRALFDRVGGFEADPGNAFTEDTWFGWRARRAGARTSFCAEAVSHRPAVALEPLEYVEDATTRRAVPGVVAGVPELRDSLLHRRVFLSPRTMKLDLALAGLALAAAADLLGAMALLHGSVEARTPVL
jgi:hypothetical protein